MQETKRVKNPRKQRKMLFNAPAHIRHKLMAAPLSSELSASRGAKTLPVRKGDTVRIQRGDNKGFEGKVSRVDLKRYRIYIEGLTREKVDGTNIFISVHPSKLQIRNLNLDDKWRKNILERKKEIVKPAKEEKVKAKPAKKAEKAIEKPQAQVEEVIEEKPVEVMTVEEKAVSAVAKEQVAEKAAVKAPAVKKAAAKKPATKKEVVPEKKAPAEEKASAKKTAKPAAKKTAAIKEAPAKEMAAKKTAPKRKASDEKNEGGQ
jgi:large subunit ribosomal protein L24